MILGHVRRCMALILLVVQLATPGAIPARAQSDDDLAALRNEVSRQYAQAKYAEAAPLAERYVALVAQKYGEEHTEYAEATWWLATVYRGEGRYPEAEPLFKRALAIIEKALGPDHLDVAVSLNSLAELYRAQGRYTEAEPLYNRALAITEKGLGGDHASVGSVLSGLALLYESQARYDAAEPLFKRALAVTEKALGPDHPDVGGSLNNLALFYRDQSRYAKAEPLYKRALAVYEKALGPDDPVVARLLYNLAELYERQARYPEAEPLLKRSLVIREKALSPDHPDVGESLNNLAVLYRVQGRYAEAEPLCKRALAIWEKALGPDHDYVGNALSGLALVYEGQARYDAAEPLYNRALAITEKALGPDHPAVANSLDNLAGLFRVQGRYDAAEPLYKRALAIKEKALGPDHPLVAISLNNLAVLYDSQDRHPEAEPLHKRALAIKEKALGPDHPSVGRSLDNLAMLAMVKLQWAQAADYWRRSTGVIIRRTERGTVSVGHAPSGKGKSEAERESGQFEALVKVAHRLAGEDRSVQARLAREMFQTAQWALASEAAQSLVQMSARGAKGDAVLATLVRERQDLVVEWQNRDAARIAAVSRRPEERNSKDEAAITARVEVIDKRIAEIDRRLTAEYPEYASFSRPQPLSVEEVQAQLASDEVLVLVLATSQLRPMPEETFIWVVSKSDVRWVRSEHGIVALSREVAVLRCGLDYEGAWGIDGSRCAQLLNATYSATVHRVGKPLPFDPARAHALYKILFGQVGDLIRDKHLLVVPSGPLTQLPLHVLVTAKPETATPNLPDYSNIAWLARSNTITVLPAVSSLNALRKHARPSHATRPYLGVGNPLLDGPDDSYAGLKQAALDRRSCGELVPVRAGEIQRGSGVKPVAQRGDIADVAALRLASPLPETADELCDVAKRVGGTEADILLGTGASEYEIKRLSEAGTLRSYRIIHFATHGALAGEISVSAEPGLLLTPPQVGTEADDGYLSASEIAGLKLDADWVILSACNTAAAETKDAEALSGLARAFFYAGTRALLVSHWYVDSNATVALITGAFAELQANPKLGRAEALRRSMLAQIEGGNEPRAHPAAWAPFVVVGEGGAGR
jgi:CHAT domain-containing protein/tetratricopeptide (TPR) repeat protein